MRPTNTTATFEALQPRSTVRSEGSATTIKPLDASLQDSVDAAAANGLKVTDAVSRRHAVAAGAARSAAKKVAIGGATEVGAMVRGDMSTAEFTRHRARDVGEAVVANRVASAANKVGKATTGARGLTRGVARSAVVSVAVSSLSDVPALARGEMSGREFAENRGVDATEAAVATAVGAAATGVVLTTATGGALAAGAGALAASTAAATAGAVAGMGTAGAAAATALAGVSAAVAGPAIVTSAVMLGTGLAIGKGFRRMRRTVKEHQEQRRDLTDGGSTSA